MADGSQDPPSLLSSIILLLKFLSVLCLKALTREDWLKIHRLIRLLDNIKLRE